MSAMSVRKRKAPDSMEQACVLCRRAEADPNICGNKLEKQGLCAHEYCLSFATQLGQQQAGTLGLRGFLPEDIQCAVNQAAQKQCFVCGERGATITCRETSCDRSFHLPCAVEGECITQYFFEYRAFCWEHRPEQAVEAAPENATCLICLDPVGERKSYGSMVCPVCKHAWFHRGCIQGQAISNGLTWFRCPHCRDRDAFLSEMLIMGIQIPFRLASWDSRAYEALGARHSRCDAGRCLCPGGREQADEEGHWELLVCSCCAAEGTHRRCSSVSSSQDSWECDFCTSLGTGSSASLQLSSPSISSQAAAASSSGSPAPESSSQPSPPGPVRDRPRSRRRARTHYSGPKRRRKM